MMNMDIVLIGKEVKLQFIDSYLQGGWCYGFIKHK